MLMTHQTIVRKSSENCAAPACYQSKAAWQQEAADTCVYASPNNPSAQVVRWGSTCHLSGPLVAWNRHVINATFWLFLNCAYLTPYLGHSMAHCLATPPKMATFGGKYSKCMVQKLMPNMPCAGCEKVARERHTLTTLAPTSLFHYFCIFEK